MLRFTENHCDCCVWKENIEPSSHHHLRALIPSPPLASYSSTLLTSETLSPTHAILATMFSHRCTSSTTSSSKRQPLKPRLERQKGKLRVNAMSLQHTMLRVQRVVLPDPPRSGTTFHFFDLPRKIRVCTPPIHHPSSRTLTASEHNLHTLHPAPTPTRDPHKLNFRVVHAPRPASKPVQRLPAHPHRMRAAPPRWHSAAPAQCPCSAPSDAVPPSAGAQPAYTRYTYTRIRPDDLLAPAPNAQRQSAARRMSLPAARESRGAVHRVRQGSELPRQVGG